MRVYVKEWMRQAGYNQTRFAKQLEISGASMSKLINGHVRWSIPKLERCAEIIGCEVIDLLRDPNEISIDAMLRNSPAEIKMDVATYAQFKILHQSEIPS